MNKDLLNKRIINLYKTGLSTVDVGRKLGISQQMVWLRLKKLGVSIRPTSYYLRGKSTWNKDLKNVMPSPWNKGKKMSLEQRQKQSETRKRLFREGKLYAYWKGKTIPIESRIKMSKIKREQILNGQFTTKITRRELNLEGKNHPNWKGGVSKIRDKMKRINLYIRWREEVFKRDNYTCQICGKRGGELQADHIKTVSEIMHQYNIQSLGDIIKCDELWNVENGRTLCKLCHYLRHSEMKKPMFYKSRLFEYYN